MSENYGSDNILPEARKQRKQMKEQLSALAKSPAPEADSTSETPRTDAIDSDRADAGSIGAYFMMRDLAWKLERELAQAKKRLIDAEEILGELASAYWRQTLNNIDDRPTRPDWPMGELIQLYWEKHK